MQIRPDNRRGPLGANPLTPRTRRTPPPPGHHGGYGSAAPDPFASILAGYPHPQTDDQLGATAQGMIDPLVQALTDSVNRRATAGAGSIRGYTNQVANDLGQYAGSAKDIFGRAEADTAASNNALADRLAGGGAQLAAGLADRLKGIGNGADPAVAGIAQGVAQTGQGSGNAVYATGNAALENLFGRGAAAEDYAAKLPEYARLEGIQRAGTLQQQAQNDIAQGASDIRGKLPELIASLRSANDQKATNLAGAQTDLFKYQTNRADAKAAAAAQQRERAVLAKMANETSSVKAQQDWNKFIISEQDRNQRAADAEAGRTARANNADANRNARTQAQIDAANRRAAAKAAADAKKTAAKTGTPPKLTAKQRQDYMGTAATIADNAKTGFTDAKGVQHPAISAYDALKEMRQEGVPDKIAVAAINRAYGTNFNPNGNLP